jgi:hypothetical protein
VTRMNWDRVRRESQFLRSESQWVPPRSKKRRPGSWQSRFASRCSRCHGTMPVGTWIKRSNGGRYTHAAPCGHILKEARDQGGVVRR